MLTDAQRDAQYLCGVCGHHWVMPQLARSAEAHHAAGVDVCTPDATIASGRTGNPQWVSDEGEEES